MRRRRRVQRHVNHERWLVSYADFITLLFAFFVVMYSAAQLDKRRAGQLATAIQTAFRQYGSLPPKPAEVGGLAAHGVPSNLPVGDTEPDDFNLLRRQVEAALTEEIASGEVGVRVTAEGLVISLREIGFFDSGSANLRPSSRLAFERLAIVLRNANSDLHVEGHTDKRSHSQRALQFQLGPIHRPRHRNHSPADDEIWLCTPAPGSFRLCPVSSSREQCHC
jgi:chemotaxis protein MotB